jgi:recombination protein RecT
VTELSQALQRSAATPEQRTILDLIERQKPAVEKALAGTIGVERFTRTILTELRRTPKLYECNPESLLGAMMLAAQLQLEPGPLGLVYFAPFKRQVTLIVDYRGFIELAYRSQLVKDVSAQLVYEGDDFDYREGTRPFLDHRPLPREKDDDRAIVAAWACARLKTGGAPFRVIYEAEWERARKASVLGSKGQGLWRDDRPQAIRKTAIRRLEPQLPKTLAFGRALEVDEQPVEPFEEALLTEGDES